jgi:hypothetical protein
MPIYLSIKEIIFSKKMVLFFTWSSQGRNSTLQPISECAGGGLKRIVCLQKLRLGKSFKII